MHASVKHSKHTIVEVVDICNDNSIVDVHFDDSEHEREKGMRVDDGFNLTQVR